MQYLLLHTDGKFRKISPKRHFPEVGMVPNTFAQASHSSILALAGEMKNIQEKTVFSSFYGHTRSIVLKLIGLSGGPGNGKSAVAEIFREEGICVIDADKVCHAIYQEKDNEVISAMRLRWGKDIFDSEGFIDRKKIAEIVFNDDGEREFLDSLLHPEIFRRINRILEGEEKNTSFAVLEAALLFESSWNHKMFRTITVWAREDIRMERLLARNWTREHAEKRIASQMPDSEKMELADYVLINNGTLEELRNECRVLLDILRKEVNDGQKQNHI